MAALPDIIGTTIGNAVGGAITRRSPRANETDAAQGAGALATKMKELAGKVESTPLTRDEAEAVANMRGATLPDGSPASDRDLLIAIRANARLSSRLAGRAQDLGTGASHPASDSPVLIENNGLPLLLTRGDGGDTGLGRWTLRNLYNNAWGTMRDLIEAYNYSDTQINGAWIPGDISSDLGSSVEGAALGEYFDTVSSIPGFGQARAFADALRPLSNGEFSGWFETPRTGGKAGLLKTSPPSELPPAVEPAEVVVQVLDAARKNPAATASRGPVGWALLGTAVIVMGIKDGVEPDNDGHSGPSPTPLKPHVPEVSIVTRDRHEDEIVALGRAAHKTDAQIQSEIDTYRNGKAAKGGFTGKYEANPKHDVKRPGVSPQPTNPEEALANSILIKDGEMSRIAYDRKAGEIVVFQFDNVSKYHGYVPPSWKALPSVQKNALVRGGWFTPKGRVIK